MNIKYLLYYILYNMYMYKIIYIYIYIYIAVRIRKHPSGWLLGILLYPWWYMVWG